MRKPRKTALTWALALFAENKSRAEMDNAVAASGGEQEPRAYAVRWLWLTSREWVTGKLTDGSNYETIRTVVGKAEGEDGRFAPARLLALAEIEREAHVVPQVSGSRQTEKHLGSFPKSRDLTAIV